MDPYILKEYIKKKEYRDKNFAYDNKIDIWSLGTVIYECFIGSDIFYSNNIILLQRIIEKGIYKIPYEIHLSKEALAFLKGMLQYEPEKRLNIE